MILEMIQDWRKEGKQKMIEYWRKSEFEKHYWKNIEHKKWERP